VKEVFIVDACRTPVGRYGGSLAGIRPDDLLALTIRALLDRNPSLPVAEIEEVIAGDANQAGESNRNVARMAALLAGLPVEIAGVTVNRLCASGLQSVIDAYRAIALGEGEAIIAGGVESMTRAPFVMAKSDQAFGRLPEIVDSTFGWRFTNPDLANMYPPLAMGETAENLADKYKISREAQDQFACDSQKKWKAAADAGIWKNEMVPVSIKQKKGDPVTFDTDEHPRTDTTREGLAKLKPVFRQGGTVTAGNSSGINDGAAISLLCSRDILKKYNLTPMARVVSAGIAGVDPSYMGIGPVPASRKAMKRAGLKTSDISLVELNEAFAAQSIPCIQNLELDPAIVNPNGGAIAIGHPLGSSGARILATLLHEMHRRDNCRYGLATLCVGVGQGVSLIVEKV